jgi:hypothetical protein
MKTSFVYGFIAVILGANSAHAGLITNGTFEAGLANWTSQNQNGGNGDFFAQTGTQSPVNGFVVPAPPEGTTAAMTDAEGPGSHLLYQDFVVPLSVPNAVFTFSYFLNNGDTQYRTPLSLDFSTPALNQQARIDIVSTSVDVFSVVAADILQNLFQTGPSTLLNTSGYVTQQVDITAALQPFLGQTLRLRASETDNVSFLNFALDNLDITVSAASAVPEPSTFGLASLFLGVIGFATARERRRRALSRN